MNDNLPPGITDYDTDNSFGRVEPVIRYGVDEEEIILSDDEDVALVDDEILIEE